MTTLAIDLDNFTKFTSTIVLLGCLASTSICSFQLSFPSDIRHNHSTWLYLSSSYYCKLHSPSSSSYGPDKSTKKYWIPFRLQAKWPSRMTEVENLNLKYLTMCHQRRCLQKLVQLTVHPTNRQIVHLNLQKTKYCSYHTICTIFIVKVTGLLHSIPSTTWEI